MLENVTGQDRPRELAAFLAGVPLAELDPPVLRPDRAAAGAGHRRDRHPGPPAPGACIYPIQPIVMRHLLEPVEFAGHELAAGSFVGAATTLVHMHPGLYPDPERFDPGRFMGSGHGPGEYFPFGGGARRCLGAEFATLELKIILSVLLGEYRIRCLDSATPVPARHSTVTGPRGGVPLAYDGPVSPAGGPRAARPSAEES
jgi:hypothetical protein